MIYKIILLSEFFMVFLAGKLLFFISDPVALSLIAAIAPIVTIIVKDFFDRRRAKVIATKVEAIETKVKEVAINVDGKMEEIKVLTLAGGSPIVTGDAPTVITSAEFKIDKADLKIGNADIKTGDKVEPPKEEKKE